MGADPLAMLVCPPADYFAGMYRGLTEVYSVRAHARAGKAFKEARMSPRAAWALLACYGKDDTAECVRVTIASKLDNGFITGIEYPFFEHLSFDEVLETIEQDLKDMGIDRIERVAEPQVGEGYYAPSPLRTRAIGPLH